MIKIESSVPGNLSVQCSNTRTWVWKKTRIRMIRTLNIFDFKKYRIFEPIFGTWLRNPELYFFDITQSASAVGLTRKAEIMVSHLAINYGHKLGSSVKSYFRFQFGPWWNKLVPSWSWLEVPSWSRVFKSFRIKSRDQVGTTKKH